MKILFFVEPQALRDGFSEFGGALEYMLPIARDLQAREGCEARLYCNPNLADMVLRCAPDLWPLVLQPSPGERRALIDTATPWGPEGEALWAGLMTDPDARPSRMQRSMLLRIRREVFEYDAVVLWGANAAVATVAEECALPRLHLELASFRPPFPEALLIDPAGVNGGASTARLGLGTIRTRMRPLSAEALRDLMLRAGAALPPPAPPRARGTRPLALLPLQLSDDANLLFHSDLPDMSAFLHSAAVPLLKAGWRVAIKPHPGAALRGGEVWEAQERCLEPWLGRDRVEILPDAMPPEALLGHAASADLVVSNNSSVAFEAMLMGRPAVVLGRACFAPRGALPDLADAIAHHADPAWRETWGERARLAASFLLASGFVPTAMAAEGLYDWLAAGTPPADPLAGFETRAWRGWPGAEALRAATLPGLAADGLDTEARP